MQFNVSKNNRYFFLMGKRHYKMLLSRALFSAKNQSEATLILTFGRRRPGDFCSWRITVSRIFPLRSSTAHVLAAAWSTV